MTSRADLVTTVAVAPAVEYEQTFLAMLADSDAHAYSAFWDEPLCKYWIDVPQRG